MKDQSKRKAIDIEKNKEIIAKENDVDKNGLRADIEDKNKEIDEVRAILTDITDKIDTLKNEIVEFNNYILESTERLEEAKQKQPKLIRDRENTKNRIEMLKKQLEIKNDIIASNDTLANQSRIDTAIHSFNLSKENHSRDIVKLKSRNVTIMQTIKEKQTDLATLEKT